MKYEHYDDLAGLKKQKLISVRPHPTLPLFIYNYTAGVNALSISEWSPALRDCRGLILDADGEVVGRPFRKFWNYEQALSDIPSDLPFTIWEKLDGSLGIVCNYRGVLLLRLAEASRVTRRSSRRSGSDANHPGWLPIHGLTYLSEIIFPENHIVVDYGETRELRLLAVMEADGKESLATFYADNRFPKVQGYPAGAFLRHGNETMLLEPGHFMQRPNAEGYVVCWSNGFRAKVKFEEYKRLHRLITQVSTKSIWELLRAGKSTAELIDRVPDTFRDWVNDQINILVLDHADIKIQAKMCYKECPTPIIESRAAYAAWVKTQPANFGLLFALYDGKPIDDRIWRMIEPKWATPFRPIAE